MRRSLSPSLNPTGIGAAIAAVYAAVVMIWNATHHHGVIDPQVIIGALGAAAFLYSRMKVTPVADPKDGNGSPLLSVAAATAIAGEVMHAVGDAAIAEVKAAAKPAPPPASPLPGLPGAKL